MQFSTNSAMALSGLLCESAMIRMAFQSSPIRNLPPSGSFDLAALIFATVTGNSTRRLQERQDRSQPAIRPLTIPTAIAAGQGRHYCRLLTELDQKIISQLRTSPCVRGQSEKAVHAPRLFWELSVLFRSGWRVFRRGLGYAKVARNRAEGKNREAVDDRPDTRATPVLWSSRVSLILPSVTRVPQNQNAH